MGERWNRKWIAVSLVSCVLGVFLVTGAQAGSYTVHVSSYKDKNQAESEVTKLEKDGYYCLLTKTIIPKNGKWYRVYLGPYKNYKDANAAAQQGYAKKTISYSNIISFSNSNENALAGGIIEVCTNNRQSKNMVRLPSEGAHE